MVQNSKVSLQTKSPPSKWTMKLTELLNAPPCQYPSPTTCSRILSAKWYKISAKKHRTTLVRRLCDECCRQILAECHLPRHALGNALVGRVNAGSLRRTQHEETKNLSMTSFLRLHCGVTVMPSTCAGLRGNRYLCPHTMRGQLGYVCL